MLISTLIFFLIWYLPIVPREEEKFSLSQRPSPPVFLIQFQTNSGFFSDEFIINSYVQVHYVVEYVSDVKPIGLHAALVFRDELLTLGRVLAIEEQTLVTGLLLRQTHTAWFRFIFFLGFRHRYTSIYCSPLDHRMYFEKLNSIFFHKEDSPLLYRAEILLVFPYLKIA